MRGSLKDHALPPELQPESSYEYPRPQEDYDFAFQERNRRVLNLADRAYPDSYGYARRVVGTRINGRRWDILER